MGNFTGSAGPHYTLFANVYEISVNTAGNSSVVRMDLYVNFDGAGGWGTYDLTGGPSYGGNVNGNVATGNFNYDFRGAGNTNLLLRTFDTGVGHDSSGNATIGWNANANMNNGGLLGTASISGSLALTHINRYAGIDGGPNFDVVTDERIRVAWHSDSPVDYVSWWSGTYDGGGHHDTPASGQGWFYLDINNLRSGTQYDFTVAVRRADSGLWTQSGTAYTTTALQNGFFMFAGA